MKEERIRNEWCVFFFIICMLLATKEHGSWTAFWHAPNGVSLLSPISIDATTDVFCSVRLVLLENEKPEVERHFIPTVFGLFSDWCACTNIKHLAVVEPVGTADGGWFSWHQRGYDFVRTLRNERRVGGLVGCRANERRVQIYMVCWGTFGCMQG